MIDLDDLVAPDRRAPAVETYYSDGSWRTRRMDSTTPFASGPSRTRMIETGAEVARFNHVRHIIRDRTGKITEVIEY
jgi:uncharacterized protein DUF2188